MIKQKLMIFLMIIVLEMLDDILLDVLYSIAIFYKTIPAKICEKQENLFIHNFMFALIMSSLGMLLLDSVLLLF